MSTKLRQYDIQAALTAVKLDAAAAFRSLRERLEVPSDGPYLLPRQFASKVADHSQHIMVVDHADNFDAVWEMARLSHNLGKHRDALAYASHAQDLQPDNPKVAARLVVILLDLHEELPNAFYDYAAQEAAKNAFDLEQSEYTLALLERAGVEIHYTDDEPEEHPGPVLAVA